MPPSNSSDSDKAAIDALQWAIRAGCLTQCYLLGMTKDDIQNLLNAVVNDLDVAAREIISRYLADQAADAGSKLISLLRLAQLASVDLPQGQGTIGSGLKMVLDQIGDEGLDQVRRHAARASIRIVGRGGVKVFGRIGSKAIPGVGWVLLGAEGASACRCLWACRDGEFTDDETWEGMIRPER